VTGRAGQPEEESKPMNHRRIAALMAFALALPAAAAAQGPPRQPNQPSAPRQTQDPGQQFERAMAAFRGGDHEAAFAAFMPLARDGLAAAQCMVGVMYQKGHAVARNPTEAARWYTMSAQGGDADAMFMLGQLYYRGEGVAQDPTRAADLFLLNAVRGDPDGQWAFGLCVVEGRGRPRDGIEGSAWLMLAAERGHEEARRELQRVQLSADDLETARGVAAQFRDMLEHDGFDPQKLPRVPVADGLVLDPRAGPAEPAQPPQREGDGGPVEVGLQIDATFLPTGDLRGSANLRFPDELYANLRKLVPDPKLFLRDLASGRADQELAADAKARYEDAARSVVLDLHMLGAARNCGDGRWEWKVENHRFVETSFDAAERAVVAFDIENALEDEGMVFRGRGLYRMPDGATDLRWDPSAETLNWQLAYRGPSGAGRLRARFDVRDRILSCLYKVYGLETGFPAQWVGKAIFTNVGDGPITDLRVRFRLGEYSELDLWHKFPELVPGQTVVAVYRPVLKKAIAELTSTTPANLVAEWRWIDAEGREREDSDGGRISILGRHEFVFSNLTEGESTGSFYDLFSNADFVAAWVTRDDPVVKQFAAAANKAAGGAGAPYSDEAAWKVLKACYEIWLANDFTYQGPVGLKDASLSFDNKTVQSMKFPRDVIRDRSGTCIELAALYCAMVHAIGLESYMILVPGHAFPVVALPSGKYLPVECTGVGGGKRHGSASFEQVVDSAGKTYEKWAKEGLVIEVDIDDAWLRGVSNPELEMVPADVLQRWGTILEFELSADQGGGRPPVQPTEPRPTPDGDARAFVGTWSGSASQPTFGGQALRWSFEMRIDLAGAALRAETSGEARVPNGWGGSDLYRFEQSLEGHAQRGELTMRGTRKALYVNGQAQPIPTDTMSLRAQGDRLVGEVRLPDGTRVAVDVQRRR
jgi:hypothetical protein